MHVGTPDGDSLESDSSVAANGVSCEHMIEISVWRCVQCDAETVSSILVEASNWLQGRGIDQWRPEWYPTDKVARMIQRHEVYLALAGDEFVGTFRIQWSDNVIWGSDSGSVGAAYVHGITVRRAWSGRGIGPRLLKWAEEDASRCGKSLLRLDCWAGNDRLRRYYLDNGFEFIGESQEHNWFVARFERKIG
jgi:GNAT superfamily N-acetyltransferase